MLVGSVRTYCLPLIVSGKICPPEFFYICCTFHNIGTVLKLFRHFDEFQTLFLGNDETICGFNKGTVPLFLCLPLIHCASSFGASFPCESKPAQLCLANISSLRPAVTLRTMSINSFGFSLCLPRGASKHVKNALVSMNCGEPFRA